MKLVGINKISLTHFLRNKHDLLGSLVGEGGKHLPHYLSINKLIF